MIAAVLAVAALDVVLVLVGLSLPGQGQPTTAGMALAAVALLLELVSFELPGVGSLSASAAVWLMVARIPSMGARWAAPGVLLTLFLRHQLRNPQGRAPAWLQIPLEGLAPLLGVVLVGKGWLYPGLVLFSAATLLVPWGGNYTPVRWQWWAWQTGLSLLAILTAPYLVEQPWAGFWVLPMTLGLQAVLHPVTARRPRRERDERDEEGPPAPTVTPLGLGGTSRAAEEATVSTALLKFCWQMLRCSDLNSALSLILQTARVGLRVQSVAVFLHDGEKLTCAAALSPFQERLQSSDLLGLNEPVTLEAWSQSRPVRRIYDQEPARLMEGETSVLAVALPSQGVLYFGRPGRTPMLEGKDEYLVRLADLAAGGLSRVRRYEQVQDELERAQQAGGRLKQWVELLSGLLEGVQALASTLDRSQVFARLEETLRRTVPHEYGWLALLDREGRLELRHDWGSADEPSAALYHWGNSVVESGLPLLLNDLSGSRFGPVLQGQQCLMVVPVFQDQSVAGALLLGSSHDEKYTRTHQHLLALAGSVLGLTLSNAGLYEDVVRTTHELEQSQAELVQAGKMVAVGKLAAGVAHEINNPLMAMLINVDILLPGIKDAEDQACLDSVRQGILRCQSIVSRLLDFSRTPSPGEPVALAPLIQTNLPLLAPPRPDQQVDLVLELDPLVKVQGRSEDLAQIVANLVTNARDAASDRFGGQPGGRVVVRARMQNGQALLEVEDNGVGIPPELQDRVMEPFFTTKQVGQGTGLGLYLTYTLVQEHGGRLQFWSQPGEGTRFQVALPAG